MELRSVKSWSSIPHGSRYRDTGKSGPYGGNLQERGWARVDFVRRSALRARRRRAVCTHRPHAYQASIRRSWALIRFVTTDGTNGLRSIGLNIDRFFPRHFGRTDRPHLFQNRLGFFELNAIVSEESHTADQEVGEQRLKIRG